MQLLPSMTSIEPPPLSALDAIYSRRATRAFTSQQVNDDRIRELLRAAVHAPTAMHLEPWAFAIVQDRRLLTRISDRAKVLIVGDDHRALARTGDGRLPAILSDPGFDIFYGAPTLIAICGKPMGMFVQADCWLAAENLMIAATALGLATCPIGFAVTALAESAIKRELDIPHDVTAIAPIIVGYASGPPPRTSRREPEIISWKR
jgi:nitroreductase